MCPESTITASEPDRTAEVASFLHSYEEVQEAELRGNSAEVAGQHKQQKRLREEASDGEAQTNAITNGNVAMESGLK